MKVVLLRHVEKVGQAGDVRDVAGGFFRNMLAPRGLAKIATPQALQEAEVAKARIAAAEAHGKAHYAALAASLNGQTLTLKRKATPEGHLFGSVSAYDIVSHMQKQGTEGIRDEHVVLDTPIKTTGTHRVPLRFGDNLKSEIIVAIEADA